VAEQRLTQQVVEVLITTTPAARVTQQVVEVLSAPAPPPPVGQTQPHVQVIS
jgi:hypothetical protein